jgi:hypothetical protein
MIVVAAIASTWVVLLALITGVCRAARLGDQAQRQAGSPASPQPDTHAARRHSRILPGRLRSPRDVSTQP